MALGEKMLDDLLTRGGKLASFQIILPDGTIKTAGTDSPEFTIKIKSREVFTQVVIKGVLGLGEQYMLGNLDIEGDLHLALTVGLSQAVNTNTGSTFADLFYFLQEKLFTNNRNRALRNVASHYDLGNEFYQRFLDSTMSYSSGYIKGEDESLEQLQLNKYEVVCQKLKLKPGETLYDIGFGWGGLLIYAAQNYSIKGYGTSISKEQLKFTQAKIEKLKLTDKIKLEFLDYRDVKGKYDKIASIEMMEHVGWKNYATYFKQIRSNLTINGLALVQVIGTFSEKVITNPWMDKYIFPGGQLPTAGKMLTEIEKAFLMPISLENIGKSYVPTLNHWLRNSEKNFDQTVNKYGTNFARMWRLYLALSIVWFELGLCRDYQVLMQNWDLTT